MSLSGPPMYNGQYTVSDCKIVGISVVFETSVSQKK